MPPTEYQVIDIVRQYDPKADFPDHPNLLALANITGGILSPMHLDYTGVDIDDPANTVWTEGNTTYVFVPTESLPLLTPLRLMGMGRLADALNEPLKEIVERVYDRPTSPPPRLPAHRPKPAPRLLLGRLASCGSSQGSHTNEARAPKESPRSEIRRDR